MSYAVVRFEYAKLVHVLRKAAGQAVLTCRERLVQVGQMVGHGKSCEGLRRGCTVGTVHHLDLPLV